MDKGGNEQMIPILDHTPVAIVGGGHFCRQLLELLFSEYFSDRPPRILGVADPDEKAEGIRYARKKGIFTTTDHTALYALDGLKVLIEITNDPTLAETIEKTKPQGVLLIDYIVSRTLWSDLLIEAEKAKALRTIGHKTLSGADVASLFTGYADRISHLVRSRCQRYESIERKLQKTGAGLGQIIEGNSIPTFVIDQDHIVTHWNQACEKLTGYAAAQIIGTRGHWKPFHPEKRPVMADLILEGVNRRETMKYYGDSWKQSSLIDGAYETEEFFPNLGRDGLWLFFTAAPIRTAGGDVVGAIETIQDRTETRRAAEEAVRQNRLLSAAQQKMAQLIQGSTMPTFVINQDHIVTHWNRALEKLSGCRAETIVGTDRQWAPFWKSRRPSMADVILDQIPEEKIKSLYREKWRKSPLIADAYEAEMFFPNLGENGKWCWFTAAPIKAADGHIIGAIETIQDRTEDKQAEEEIKRHNRELKTLCRIYQSLGAPLDIEFRMNLTLRQITEVLGSDFLCIYLLDRDGRYHLRYSYGACGDICRKMPVADEDSMVYRVARQQRLMTFNLSQTGASPELALLKREHLKAVAYAPIFDRKKNTLGVIRSGNRSVREYTDEQKNLLELTGNRIGVAIENSILQEELQEKAYFQAKLINSSNNGIVATDNSWKILVFNPQAEELFGLARKDVVGKIDARDLFPRKVVDWLLQNRSPAGPAGTPPWEEATLHTTDHDAIPVIFSGSLLYRGDKVMGSVAFFQDLREIKRLEQELIQSEQLAAVGQTVAGMAHCIKNILNGFTGGSYLLNIGIDRNNSDKIKTGWRMIQRNIDRTSGLVMDLLSYSREREPEYEWCRPNRIAADAMEVMAENARAHAIEMVQKMSPAVEKARLDPHSLHRCLVNLISNAIDACAADDNPGKKHRVVVRSHMEAGDHLRFDVTDNGIGIPAAIRARLFTSFFSTKGANGTGLGLLVTRKLAEAHGGTIDVTSIPGKGTVFSLRFPCHGDAVLNAGLDSTENHNGRVVTVTKERETPDA